jgi:hypothetical protein
LPTSLEEKEWFRKEKKKDKVEREKVRHEFVK